MVIKYNTITETVTAIQFTFDNLKEVYLFLGYADCTFTIRSRNLNGVLTDQNGNKLSVQKNNYVVKDANGVITIWTSEDFKKHFTEVKTSA